MASPRADRLDTSLVPLIDSGAPQDGSAAQAVADALHRAVGLEWRCIARSGDPPSSRAASVDRPPQGAERAPNQSGVCP
jgi:hypothetical protein